MNLIEGRNPILEALRAGRNMNKILISNDVERHSAIAEILHLAKERKIPVEWLAPEILRTKSSTRSPQGVIAYASAKEYVDVHDLLDIAKSKNEPAFYVMLDGLEDPHNLGAIIRTAEASGVHGVIIPQRRAVGLTETVAKTSAGAIEYVPVARVVNLNNTIKTLKENNIWVIGIDQDGKKTFTEIDFKLPTAIVIGGEGKGLSRLVKENCDEVVSLPMKGKISSLNASVAAAVSMYEVLRQRSI
ncbi:MAG: 23S rRNA (guanosine(2251)-2'-O)-methyltransferase RlmB [bacterium]